MKLVTTDVERGVELVIPVFNVALCIVNQKYYIYPYRRLECSHGEGHQRMTVSDEAKNRLQEIVASANGKDMEWAESTYEQKLSEIQEKSADGVDESALRDHAVRMVRSEIVSNSRMGGEVQECNILAIGHGGYQTWSGDNGDKRVLLSYGVVQPPDEPAGIGVFINDETTGVDLENVRKEFQTLNNLTGWYSVGESDELRNTYILNSTDRTKVESEESEMSREDKRDFLHQFTEEARISNIRESMSKRDENGRTVNFGADIKRLNATVVDWSDNENSNAYTLLDDSVVDASELGDDIVSERARTPGLTAWCPDDFLQWGVNSQLEVYGAISTMSSGQIVMNVYGVVPLIPMDMDYSDAGGADDSKVDEQSI